MSSPVVESVRTIPLIIEKGNFRNQIPMDVDEISGFPFDRNADRDGQLRSQLDDIAKRHPEFAEHLGNFSRRRQSSGEDTENFHRRFERPFGGHHFDRFGFPFDREDFDPEKYTQQFYEQQPEFHHQQPQNFQNQQPSQQGYQQQTSYQPQPEYNQQPQSSQQQHPPPQNTEGLSPESGRNNIQQSNTVDLGQKQEPVNDRNQRSMSAPPSEKAPRFTSSVNIPVNQPSEGDDMAQTQADGKTTERIIPIHIEGRDEPVLPKTASPTFSQPHSAGAGPQPERIFGQRPEHFTQFVNREPRQYDNWHRPGFDQRFSPEENLRQQRFAQQNVPPYYHQQRPAPQNVPPQPKDEIPIPVQREFPQTKQQAPPQEQQTAPPQQPPQPKPAPQQQKPKTPIEQIEAIQKDVAGLLAQVEQFSGKPKDKQYLYLDEMLTRNLLKLDNIDTQGQENIRSARKEAIRSIEKTISVLEAKAAGNVAAPKATENMEVEEKSQDQAADSAGDENKQQTEVQTMETESVSETSDNKPENQPQPMELLPPENTVNQDSVLYPERKEEETLPPADDSQKDNTAPVVDETRAVLVTSEVPKTEDKSELMEVKEETMVAPAIVEEPKQEQTCEGQESNIPVAEAIKKFEGKENETKKENTDEKNEASQVQQEEKKTEAKKEDKKEKKKGKKKVEKKEK